MISSEDKNRASNNAVTTNISKDKGPSCGIRHFQMFLSFGGVFIGYATRLNLSIAIVAMTSVSNLNPDTPVYKWNNQGTILSAFTWGYCLSQILTGYFADRLGSYWILLVGMGLNSLLCTITPFLAAYGSGVMIACRSLQGIAQGPLFPCVQFLLGKWTASSERARFVAIIQAGIQTGCIFSVAFSGWVSSTWLGWPWCFYITGIMGFAWVVFWACLGSDSPSQNKNISTEERCYIKDEGEEEERPKSVPWKHILRCVPFWTLLFYSMLNEYGFSMFTNDIPTYMSHVLNFEIQANGFLSSLPYLVNLFVHFFNGVFVDYIINKQWVSLLVGRKISGSIGATGSAIACIVLGFLTRDHAYIAVTFVILGYAIHAPAGSLIFTNLLDIAPRYNGTLMGVINTCANLFSSLAPLTVQWVVVDKSDVSQWAVVFFVMAGLQITSTVLLNCFASAEVQYWNNMDNKNDEKKDTESNL